MSFHRLGALIVKEFYQIVRDPSSILIAAVLPVLLIFIFTYAVSLDVNHLRVGVVLEDDSEEAVNFVNAFLVSRYFEVTVAGDRRELDEPLLAGEIRGMVVIPQDFTRRSHDPLVRPQIQIITDGSEPNTANFVENYAQGAYQAYLRQRRLENGLSSREPVAIVDRVWYNPELESRYFLLPGALALIMTLIGTLLTALVVAREWERGTMEALLSTGITKTELLLGKLIPYFCLGMLSMLLSVGAMILFFGVPLRGSFVILMLTGAVFLLTALGLGLFISVATKNQFVACQVAFLAAFMPSMMLSGFIFEINSMPAWLQLVCRVIPATYLVSCLHSIFLVGNVPEILLPNLGFLLLISLLFLVLIFATFKKRID